MPDIYLEWAKIGIEFLKVIAWPILIGVLAGWLFLQPITRLIDRIRKIGREGLEAGPVEQQGLDARKTAEQDLAKVPVDPDPLVQAWVKPLKAQLDEVVKGGGDAEKILLGALAKANLREHFERTYNLIWGSQIAVLQTLNTIGNVNVEQLRPMYQAAVDTYPLMYKNYTLDHWLDFMQRSILVVQVDDTIAITPEGKEFLKYLIDLQYSSMKVG